MKHVEVIVGSRVPIGWIAGVDHEVANQNQRNILGVFFSIILRCHFIFCEQKVYLYFFFVNLLSSNYHFIYLFISSIGTELDGRRRQKMNFHYREIYRNFSTANGIQIFSEIHQWLAAMFNSAWSRCYEYRRPWAT